MYKLNVRHPIGNREFDTPEDAVKFGHAFGVDVRQIVEIVDGEEIPYVPSAR